MTPTKLRNIIKVMREFGATEVSFPDHEHGETVSIRLGPMPRENVPREKRSYRDELFYNAPIKPPNIAELKAKL